MSGGYFTGLGVQPAVGRLIGPEDDRAEAEPAVAITYEFWQRRFAGSAGVVGRSMLLNSKPFTIVGVAAPEFFGVNLQSPPELFIPMRQIDAVDVHMYRQPGARFLNNHFYWIEMIGRLRPGVSLQQAQAELPGLFQQWVAGTARDAHDRNTLPTLWLQEGGSGMDSLRRVKIPKPGGDERPLWIFRSLHCREARGPHVLQKESDLLLIGR